MICQNIFMRRNLYIWCQFYPHFKSSFFVQKCFAIWAFSFGCVIFYRRMLKQKLCQLHTTCVNFPDMLWATLLYGSVSRSFYMVTESVCIFSKEYWQKKLLGKCWWNWQQAENINYVTSNANRNKVIKNLCLLWWNDLA